MPVLVLSLLSTESFAGAAGDPFAEAIAAARARAQAIVTRGDAPGVAVTVYADHRIVWSEGFGLSNLEDQVAVTPMTRFRIGSLSKAMTAATAALLAHRGQLDLDAPIQRYVPAFPVQPQPITPRMLILHLSGIRHYGRNDYIVTRHYERLADALELFANDPLVAPPGTKHAYSTYGYTLLGAAIESATGKPFCDVVRAAVLDPFGMPSTLPDSASAIIPHRAQHYERGKDGGFTHEPFIDTSSRLPGGGYLSTPEDLVRFTAALLSSPAIPSDVRRELFTPGRLSSGESTDYAFGWRIGKDAAGRTIYHHGGEALGGRAFVLAYPEEQVIMALAANANITFAEREAIELASGFVRASRLPANAGKPAPWPV